MEELNQLLNERGHYEIDKVRVNRRPIDQFIPGATYIGSIITGSKPSNDKTFNHTWLEVSLINKETGNREVIGLSKEEKIIVNRNLSGGIDGYESMNVDLKNKNITLNDFIDNAKLSHYRSGKQYEKYSLKCYNCQAFSILSLRGSALNNDELNKFIWQNAESIVPNWLDKISIYATNLYNKFK